MSRKKASKLFILAITAAVIAVSGFGCKNPSGEVQKKIEPVELTYWRAADSEDDFTDIIEAYNASHPNITITMKIFRPEEYEQALLEALAEDRGPDIFSFDQSWLKNYQAKLEPMPKDITMAYQVIKGTIKKEVTYELRTTASPTLRQIKSDFADIVYDNAVLDGSIYGLPMSLETLLMFYNKDILNRSGVAQVPTDWKAFQEAAQKITRQDSKGNIVQSGAALGLGKNVSYNFDILSLLMMQNGAQMTSASGAATFAQSISRDFNPGVDALQFYADFASPIKNVYSWNEKMSNSLESFLAGKTGFVFAYQDFLKIVRTRAPKLNLGIAAVPQVNQDSAINFASYWLEGVSKKSTHPAEAWDFVLFATAKDQAKKFLDKTGRPTALKSLINEQSQIEDLYPASTQTLTAGNWYRGKNITAAKNAFSEMADKFYNAASDREINQILETAVQKINQTL